MIINFLYGDNDEMFYEIINLFPVTDLYKIYGNLIEEELVQFERKNIGIIFTFIKILIT